ncbi:MAG: type IV pilus secretin PilQ [Gammaproteobacteria bacterium]
MSTKQIKTMGKFQGRFGFQWLLVLVLCLQSLSALAEELAINNLEFSSLAGNQLQIQLDLSGSVVEPKVFQTDNPARIALDFDGVKSNLAKKSFPINQGAVNTVYVIEASGRTRVVVNLTEKVPYEAKTVGNQYFLVLKSAGAVEAVNEAVKSSVVKEASLSRFLPEQGIKSIDFRRGPNGEGRLLLGLVSPNTMVDTKQVNGKVVLSFLNTKVPDSLVKSFDVLDFATPVQRIEVSPRGDGTIITVTPSHPNFDYSSYQADNVLTVEFRPLTPAEKEAQLREKQPYIGSKLSLNFQDIDVRSVLMILADHIKTQEGKEINIVTTDSVTGSIALHVNDVPWDQVLDVVMKLRGLSKRENGNVILIGPTEEIKVLEEKELEARKIYEQLEPIVTENIQINYARAGDICNVLIGRGNFNQGGGPSASSSSSTSASGGASSRCSMIGGTGGATTGGAAQQIGSTSEAPGLGISDYRLISARGTVIVDARTNTLIVKDTAKQLEQIHKMIDKLDVPVRQVLIETRIVIANKGFAQELGVKFGAAKMACFGSSQCFAVGGAGTKSFSNAKEDDSGNIGEIQDTLVDLGARAINTYPPAALGMTLMRGADYVLNLELSALQNDNQGEIISNPRVMTSDRVKATIIQGSQVPYSTSSALGATNVQFKDAFLELSVTPQITPSGAIIMDLLISKDNPTAGISPPPIEKREITTLVKVNDGETVVLGGVYEDNTGKDYYKVPFFADIPGIGFLFKKTIRSQAQKELLIFVTPKIVKDELTTP